MGQFLDELADHRDMSRTWSLVLAMLAAALLAVVPATADAQRSFAKRFGANDSGDITMTANTLMTCPSACAQANAAATQIDDTGKVNNNDFTMALVDADGDGATTSTSSTATLDLPNGAEVLFAGLYWGAKTSAGTSG